MRTYGRDSLLVGANLLVAPLLASLGLRVGLQSDERPRAKMEAEAASLRKQGYLVASVETFVLRGIGRSDAGPQWYRVTYEKTSQRETGVE